MPVTCRALRLRDSQNEPGDHMFHQMTSRFRRRRSPLEQADDNGDGIEDLPGTTAEVAEMCVILPTGPYRGTCDCGRPGENDRVTPQERHAWQPCRP